MPDRIYSGGILANSSMNDPRSMAGKAITILAELAASSQPPTMSQLMRRTGFAKTTTHRLLGELLVTRRVAGRGNSVPQ